eukprot:6490714-Amphidinium_carterae.1
MGKALQISVPTVECTSQPTQLLEQSEGGCRRYHDTSCTDRKILRQCNGCLPQAEGSEMTSVERQLLVGWLDLCLDQLFPLGAWGRSRSTETPKIPRGVLWLWLCFCLWGLWAQVLFACGVEKLSSAASMSAGSSNIEATIGSLSRKLDVFRRLYQIQKHGNFIEEATSIGRWSCCVFG